MFAECIRGAQFAVGQITILRQPTHTHEYTLAHALVILHYWQNSFGFLFTYEIWT